MRGAAATTKIHHKGKEEDFIIFVESAEAVAEWKRDSSKPLVDVVTAFKIFKTHKHGAQGEYDTASKADLENEFGTSNDDDVIKQILNSGSIQSNEMSERSSTTNDSMGGKAKQPI